MFTREPLIAQEIPPKRPGEFRIAHLSDLHFCADRVPLVTRIKRMVYRSRPEGLDVIGSALADLQSVAVDHVVVTGDLTESAKPQEYDDAAHLLKPLSDLGALSVVPGNHDVCYARKRFNGTALARVPIKLRRFVEYFGCLIPDAYPQDLHIEKRHAFPFVKMLGNGKIALIGIDTTSMVPRQALPLNTLGTIGKRQFRTLQKILASDALREKTKVVLMHHHLLLMPVSDWGDSVRGLRKSRQLLELFYSTRVDLVLHGHRHYPFCWQSHTFQRHDLAIICAGPPNARWMDSARLEDTLVYNVYCFKDGLVRIHYRQCPHRLRQQTTTFEHQG